MKVEKNETQIQKQITEFEDKLAKVRLKVQDLEAILADLVNRVNKGLITPANYQIQTKKVKTKLHALNSQMDDLIEQLDRALEGMVTVLDKAILTVEDVITEATVDSEEDELSC